MLIYTPSPSPLSKCFGHTSAKKLLNHDRRLHEIQYLLPDYASLQLHHLVLSAIWKTREASSVFMTSSLAFIAGARAYSCFSLEVGKVFLQMNIWAWAQSKR